MLQQNQPGWKWSLDRNSVLHGESVRDSYCLLSFYFLYPWIWPGPVEIFQIEKLTGDRRIQTCGFHVQKMAVNPSASRWQMRSDWFSHISPPNNFDTTPQLWLNCEKNVWTTNPRFYQNHQSSYCKSSVASVFNFVTPVSITSVESNKVKVKFLTYQSRSTLCIPFFCGLFSLVK